LLASDELLLFLLFPFNLGIDPPLYPPYPEPLGIEVESIGVLSSASSSRFTILLCPEFPRLERDLGLSWEENGFEYCGRAEFGLSRRDWPNMVCGRVDALRGLIDCWSLYQNN
jgi:hypothetical protein